MEEEENLGAMKEILKHLIGKDPRETSRINDLMDSISPKLNLAKSPIDMACWDILGKVRNIATIHELCVLKIILGIYYEYLSMVLFNNYTAVYFRGFFQ